MFSHISVGVGDFDRGFRFYRALMEVLDNELRFHDAEKRWAGWHGKEKSHYHPNYHGAYFRDPDGNKTCVACHEPEFGPEDSVLQVRQEAK